MLGELDIAIVNGSNEIYILYWMYHHGSEALHTGYGHVDRLE